MADPCKNSVVNEQVYDSVAAANFKVVAEGVAHRSALVQSNDVYDQQAQRIAERRAVERLELEHAETRAAARRATERAEQLHFLQMQSALATQTAINSAAAKLILSVTPEQAVDDSKVLTGDDVAAKMASEYGAQALGAGMDKIVSVTPPTTDSAAAPGGTK